MHQSPDCVDFAPLTQNTGVRIGEARHPGPGLTLSTSNPGGLRNKEALISSLGPGIHQFSETHVSAHTASAVKNTIKFIGMKEHRHLSTHFGHHAAVRANSQWAGTWSGVASVSDFVCKPLQLDWPTPLWESSRVQATLHNIGLHQILVVNIYGYPRGPTWPKAASLTSALLEHVSKQIVFGFSGLAAICGDMNFNPDELHEFAVWKSLGWQSAQDLALARWNQEIQMTCKHATQRDQVWLSPKLAALCKAVELRHVFSGHSSVLASFDLEEAPTTFLSWPQPSNLPWHEWDHTTWMSSDDDVPHFEGRNSTSFYAQWAQSFENDVNKKYHNAYGQCLDSRFLGRGQRLSPTLQARSPPSCRASRDGGVSLAFDLPGRAVLLWYKQLRRFEAFLHSAKSGKATLNAQIYRTELWGAILRSPGFHGSFAAWWNQQDFAPVLGELVHTPPNAALAQLYYMAFEHRFREFESWHLNQRNKLLRAKHAHCLKALHSDLREPCRDQVSLLWDEHKFGVIALDEHSHKIHVDGMIPTALHCTWEIDGKPADLFKAGDELVDSEDSHQASADSEIVQKIWFPTPSSIQEKLGEYWHSRWNSAKPPTTEEWTRITGFVQAFIPSSFFEFPPLSVRLWRSALSNFRPKAARGPDGFARQDLQNMTDAQVSSLLGLLHSIETADTPWPKQLLEGFVLALAKQADSHTPNHFRPIVLLSLVYRCWASLRSRQILSQLATKIHQDAYGYIPGREAGQFWALLSMEIERSLQEGVDFCGLSTDITKAFNFIGRDQLFFTALHLGLDSGFCSAWRRFLDGFTRRFSVHSELGSPIASRAGFPEGCPLSVSAMALLDFCLHIYQNRFASHSRTLTFVDNLALTSSDASFLAAAFVSLRSFLSLWGLSLDLTKSFVWGTSPHIRKQLAPFGLSIRSDALDLGGVLSYEASHRNRLFFGREQQLTAKWVRLRRSTSPLALKLVAVPTVFWAKALHATSSCVFSDVHVQRLRSTAIAALGLKVAGASPLLRLSLAVPATADPGFFQLTQVVCSFRRFCRKSPELFDLWFQFISLTVDVSSVPAPNYCNF